MATTDSKYRNISANNNRRLKIFENITTKDEENLLESEKQNDNWNNSSPWNLKDNSSNDSKMV